MQIGRYRVVRELANGGMARVTLARSPTGRFVAIKRPLADEPAAYDRLLDEAQAGARLSHPNLVETLDFFTEDGVPHLVVGYVQGRTLLEIREKEGALDPLVVVRLGRQIAEALHVVHTATDGEGTHLEMIHRDISPSNIVVSEDGNAHLIDLGIARSTESVSQQTKTGFLRGKVSYLAPELFFGEPATYAADIWALGLVLFEAAIGHKAFRGKQQEVVAQIVGGRVLELWPDEKLDPALEGALLRLLHPNPESRIHRAKDAAALLAMVEGQLGEEARQLAADVSSRAPTVIMGADRGPPVVDQLLNDPESESITLDVPLLAGALNTELLSKTMPERAKHRVPAEVSIGEDAPFELDPTWLRSQPTTLLRRTGRTSATLVPLPEDKELTPKVRLQHYMEELRELTSPAQVPPGGDPWAMDSSPR